MITIIILAFLIGFLSYLTPTGPVTVLIFKNTLNGKYGKALGIIGGSTLIQIIWSSLSLILITAIISEKLIILSKWISSIMFLCLGVFLIISRGEKSENIIHFKDLSKKEKATSISTGIFLTLLNPTIIFSWLTINTLLISFNLIKIVQPIDYFIFTASATIGIITGSLLMMYLVHIYKKKY